MKNKAITKLELLREVILFFIENVKGDRELKLELLLTLWLRN